jgi:hypothetical protein
MAMVVVVAQGLVSSSRSSRERVTRGLRSLDSINRAQTIAFTPKPG